MSIIANPSDMNLGVTYTFDTLAPSILKQTYERIKLTGVITYEIAQKLANVDITHRQVYPLLGVSAPVHAKDLTYLSFINTSNETIILASAWINFGTVTVVDTTTILVEIHDTDISKISYLRNNLILLGFPNLNITTR